MDRTVTRSGRYQATRERILATAMEIVRERGLEGLSVHALARELDYTPGALYRYFDSKDALIAALTVRVLSHFGDVAHRARAKLDCGPLGYVLASLLVYRDLARVAPEDFGLLSVIIGDPRTLVPDAELVAPAVTAIQTELAPLAAALAAAGVSGAHERALALFASAHGVLVMRKQVARLPGLNLERMYIDTLTGLCLGWGVDGASLRAELQKLDEIRDLIAFAGGL